MQLKKMKFHIKHNKLKAVPSSIDVALWIIVDLTDEHFDHKRKTYGYVLTYVDDFFLLDPPTCGKRSRRRFRGSGK